MSADQLVKNRRQETEYRSQNSNHPSSEFQLLSPVFCLLNSYYCNMPYEVFLALRHLRSRQKRRLARVTSLIAVVGIAVGLAALIFALALANGFRDEMRDKILRGTAHLTVMRSDGQRNGGLQGSGSEGCEHPRSAICHRDDI